LWLSVSVSCIRYSKGANLGLKCVRMRLGPGSARTRWGSAQAPPGPLAAIGGCLLLRRRGRKGKREGRGWEGGREKGGKEGRGKGGKGMGREKGKGRGEERGKEKDDLHPTLFLGPAPWGTSRSINWGVDNITGG